MCVAGAVRKLLFKGVRNEKPILRATLCRAFENFALPSMNRIVLRLQTRVEILEPIIPANQTNNSYSPVNTVE